MGNLTLKLVQYTINLTFIFILYSDHASQHKNYDSSSEGKLLGRWTTHR